MKLKTTVPIFKDVLTHWLSYERAHANKQCKQTVKLVNSLLILR